MNENSDLLPTLVIRKVRNGFEVHPVTGSGCGVPIDAIRVFNLLGSCNQKDSLLYFLECVLMEEE